MKELGWALLPRTYVVSVICYLIFTGVDGRNHESLRGMPSGFLTQVMGIQEKDAESLQMRNVADGATWFHT
ncbi:hypothetical protein GGR57DRAFT_463579 [Xylariaceae sp. FL1272]|nr:hypothetical protein GGR57DRAFT_463579 [Xylariaceae sp. FL1272]